MNICPYTHPYLSYMHAHTFLLSDTWACTVVLNALDGDGSIKKHIQRCCSILLSLHLPSPTIVPSLPLPPPPIFFPFHLLPLTHHYSLPPTSSPSPTISTYSTPLFLPPTSIPHPPLFPPNRRFPTSDTTASVRTLLPYFPNDEDTHLHCLSRYACPPQSLCPTVVTWCIALVTVLLTERGGCSYGVLMEVITSTLCSEALSRTSRAFTSASFCCAMTPCEGGGEDRCSGDTCMESMVSTQPKTCTCLALQNAYM